MQYFFTSHIIIRITIIIIIIIIIFITIIIIIITYHHHHYHDHHHNFFFFTTKGVSTAPWLWLCPRKARGLAPELRREGAVTICYGGGRKKRGKLQFVRRLERRD